MSSPEQIEKRAADAVTTEVDRAREQQIQQFKQLERFKQEYEQKLLELSQSGIDVEQLKVYRTWELPSLQTVKKAPPIDVTAITEQAKKEGYDAGYAEGLAAGKLRAQQMSQQMASLCEAMSKPFENQDAIIVQDLSALAVRIAETVVQRELHTQSDAIETVISEALGLLGDVDGRIEVTLNPSDSVLVKELLGQVLDDQKWRIVEDSKQLPGGCEIKTPVSYVDASMNTRLSQVINQLAIANEGPAEEEQ